jgi:hypothetical protein
LEYNLETNSAKKPSTVTVGQRKEQQIQGQNPLGVPDPNPQGNGNKIYLHSSFLIFVSE